VKGKKLLVVGLAALVVLGSLFVAACGGGDDQAAKDALRTALDVIDADIDEMTTTMTSGGGGAADVKAAKEEIAPHWQAVVDACEGVEGADAAKATQLWDDVAAAIDSLPDDADLTTLATAVLGPVTALTDYVAELRTLVGESTEG
jgi:type II secretory pathway pseudopilin PulG